MRKLIAAGIVLAFLSLKIQAQILQPVKWSYAAKKVSAAEAVIFIKATIEPGWHVYSQHVKDGGPVKTTFTFNSSQDYSLVGPTTEPGPIVRMEKAFNMEVGFFEKSVIFKQKVKLKGKRATVTGKLEFMTCNDQKCLPPDEVDFNIPVE